MKLKFEIEIEIPDATEYAESVYSHIYEDDYYEDDSLGYQLTGYIMDALDNNWMDIVDAQIPINYRKQYENTLNCLKSL